MEPIDVGRLAVDALNQGEWSRVVELTDSEDIERWYRGLVDFTEPNLPPITPALLKEHQPDLPDAVAQHRAAEFNRRRAEERGSLHGLFAGIGTRAELATISPSEALAHYLQAQDPLWQFEQRATGLDASLIPYVRQGMPELHRHVIGVVSEGEDLAHVVYRRGIRGPDSRALEAGGDLHVATLKRGPDGWRLRMQGELFQQGGSVSITAIGRPDQGTEG